MSSKTATETRPVPLLRKRIRVLERSHHASSPETKVRPLADLADITLSHGGKDDLSPPLSDYESLSGSESSEGEGSRSSFSGSRSGSGSDRRRTRAARGAPSPRRPSINTNIPPYSYQKGGSPSGSPLSPNSRAWYEFDLAVVVALVSPLGNWLTGTDHVKNLLLIVLLVFYLHQIIEVPWTLYQNARPRAPPPPSPADNTDADERAAALAASELRRFELFFLALTVASPLAGAALLRYATDALLGPAAVSWFSTALFVLATGLRPAAHLAERLAQRTTALHAAAAHGAPQQTTAVRALEERIARLEAALEKTAERAARAADDAHAHVDDAVDAVAHALRAHERRWGRCADKVAALDADVKLLSTAPSREGTPALGPVHAGGLLQALRAEIAADVAALRRLVLGALPKWLVSPVQALCVASASTFLLKERKSAEVGPAGPLATVHEEDEEVEVAIVKRAAWIAFVAWPYEVATALAGRVGYAATLPVRAVVRLMSSAEY
ncbi:hypothetical protein HYPSUDRAFT_63850 [Hypholoma sublateritium FD-334 SS-4]|uniref:Uncharacterized protein n=1 Tax=Hypholoma sublateritium (strain FD-334 SS-4) TaxID=945553 RepID=A0A0D2MRH2_HYPSF|nr:hypothetical protein HYPSUDRAFT_63850 [Hypholoma sublateritium FD-334 SS-4]